MLWLCRKVRCHGDDGGGDYAVDDDDDGKGHLTVVTYSF